MTASQVPSSCPPAHSAVLLYALLRFGRAQTFGEVNAATFGNLHLGHARTTSLELVDWSAIEFSLPAHAGQYRSGTRR
jgi:hypothetical protein